MSRGILITPEHREEISRMICAGASGRTIGKALGRHHSVVNREIQRAGGRQHYRAHTAHRISLTRKLRPKPRKLDTNARLLMHVNAGLAKYWSPRQISHRLVLDFPDDDTMRMSHEQIYQTVYFQARGGLRAELKTQLRRGQTHRVSRDWAYPR